LHGGDPGGCCIVEYETISISISISISIYSVLIPIGLLQRVITDNIKKKKKKKKYKMTKHIWY
jgi:hypothetical protein